MNDEQKKLLTTAIVSLMGLVGLGGLATTFANTPNLNNLNLGNILSVITGPNNSKAEGNKKTEIIGDRVEKVYVERSVDGDTIELSDGRKVRFLSMDTPETVKANTPIMCYGPEAKEASKKLVEHKTIYLNYDKEKTDRYGRDLRFLYLTEQDAKDQNIDKSVNAGLVRDGYARSISYSPNTLARKPFDALMQTAQDQKIGVWSKCAKPFEE